MDLPDFWNRQRRINADKAIFHQWQQLEDSGCIHNFRIAAGEAEGFREGWFFADSDAFKWLDAASRILAVHNPHGLNNLVEEFIQLVGRAQADDGYIFTYNQIHFPGIRWQNLQIEHELYCHGHLIEAGVSHNQSTGQTTLLKIACKAADRIVADFSGRDPEFTPGHEEIEIAFLRLYQILPDRSDYLDIARQFLEMRGKKRGFALSIIKQNRSVGKRDGFVKKQKQSYLADHPGQAIYTVPPGNKAKSPWNAKLRWFASALTGKFFQQHAPMREQTVPVGHSVRFAYLETASAMLSGLTGDISLLPPLEKAWQHMVDKRMYITGGIGSLPGMEGFGNDYELDPEVAYAETCAALGCLFWNFEMSKITGQAKYSDLFEWQLYNAAAVGMGLDGSTYLYNNPLTCRGGVTRQPWYAVPCCPSNISRTWAVLDQYMITEHNDRLMLQQYISSSPQTIEYKNNDGTNTRVTLRVESSLPWEGTARVILDSVLTSSGEQTGCRISLRHPSWSPAMAVSINGSEPLSFLLSEKNSMVPLQGYDPQKAVFREISTMLKTGDWVDIHFDLPILSRKAHPRVKNHRGRAAITRGPLVYCLESIDNPGLDIFNVELNPHSLEYHQDDTLAGGMVKLTGRSSTDQPLTLIPYHLWGNRGESQMTVWIRIKE